MQPQPRPSLQSVQHKKLDQTTVNIRPDLGKPENQELESWNTESIHPDQAAPEPLAAGVEREHLIPVDAPPPHAYAASPDERVQAIDDFVMRVASISEGEYGDWMRRATVYWWHLTDALYSVENPRVGAILAEMNRIIEFNPNFLILETSRKVIAMALEIRGLLGAPMSLNEAPVSIASQTSERPVPEYSQRLKNPREPQVSEIVGGPNSQGFIGKG